MVRQLDSVRDDRLASNTMWLGVNEVSAEEGKTYKMEANNEMGIPKRVKVSGIGIFEPIL